jgi:hypothetical protein
MNISEILEKKFLGLEWSISNNEYENFVWLDETKKPTKKQLETMWLEIEEEKLNLYNIKTNAYKKLGLTDEEINAIL